MLIIRIVKVVNFEGLNFMDSQNNESIKNSRVYINEDLEKIYTFWQ